MIRGFVQERPSEKMRYTLVAICLLFDKCVAPFAVLGRCRAGWDNFDNLAIDTTTCAVLIPRHRELPRLVLQEAAVQSRLAHYPVAETHNR